MSKAPILPDFSGAILKVEHASRHIAAFAREAERYFAKRPYDVVQAPSEQNGVPGYHLYERLRFPARRLALLIGDSVHNLRSALDHLVCACAAAQGGAVDSCQFPIARSATGWEKKVRDDLAKAGPLARKLVLGLQPTPLGQPLLFALHRLDIADKHRLIVPIDCAMDVEIQVGGFDNLAVETVHGATAPSARASCFIPAPAGYETALAHDFSFTGDVIFPPDSALAGQPCHETLLAMSRAVADVVVAFETAFKTAPLSHAIAQRS